MKNKLQLIIIALGVFFASSNAFSQVQFGFRGGMNFSNLQADKLSYSSIPGVNAGLVMYTNLDNPFYFQTGLMYSGKGGKTNDFSSKLGGEAKFRYNTFEMPLNFGFQINASDALSIAPYAGFYGAYTVSGQIKVSGKSTQSLFNNPGTGYTYNKMDAGLNVGLNFIINSKWAILGQYQIGLANQYDNSDLNMKQRGLSFSLDYLF